MVFRPVRYPCTNQAPHGQHEHTDGPGAYMYRCEGKGPTEDPNQNHHNEENHHDQDPAYGR